MPGVLFIALSVTENAGCRSTQRQRIRRIMLGPLKKPLIDVPVRLKEQMTMPNFHFALIVAAQPMSHEQILDATDALGKAGCTDASIRGHAEGMELLFARAARSLQAAISSAAVDVEKAGFGVIRLEMEREAIPSGAGGA